MGYVNDNLMPGEEVLYRARLHRSIFIVPVFLALVGLLLTALYIITLLMEMGMNGEVASVLLRFGRFGVRLFFIAKDLNAQKGAYIVGGYGAFFFLIGAHLFVYRLIEFKTSEFAVTSKRVLIKRGFIRRHSLEILLAKVESIGVDQSPLGRLLGFGTIVVSGTGGTKERFKNISRPLEFRKNIQAHLPA